MAIELKDPITKTAGSVSGQKFDVNSLRKKASNTAKSAEEVFKESQKKYGIISASVGGGLIASGLAGALTIGKEFPAKFLQFLSDLFGSGAAVAAPYMEAKNEHLNFKKEKDQSFDFNLKKFYRVASHGLFKYIYERYLNPENWRSGYHITANIINLPFTLFSSYARGFGNTQGLVALNLMKNEQNKAKSAAEKGEKEKEEDHTLRANSYEKLYGSAQRLLTLGSIANPVMPCMIYAADAAEAIHKTIKGENSIGSFIEKPFLNISKGLSLLIAFPEAFAKGIDSFMRVTVNEREHLKPVLPSGVYNKLEKWGNSIDKKISQDGNNWLKNLKNSAEMIFHTLSPFAMISLFMPMLNKKFVDEDVQAIGGIPAFLDKWAGRYAKTLTTVFTGFYVAFGRLPQGVLQSIYFGRKLYGKHILKEKEEVTQEKLVKLGKSIHDNSIIAGISKLAKKGIEKLVPNFYSENVDHEYGIPKYDRVLANYSFAQAEQKHKVLLNALKILAVKNSEIKHDKLVEIVNSADFDSDVEFYKKEYGLDLIEIIENIEDSNVQETISKIISDFCLEHARKECQQGNYKLTNEEELKIGKLINKKINVVKGTESEELLKPKFAGSVFLARNFLSSLDIQSRIVDWSHDKKLKLEVYESDEKNKAFNNELEVVVAENADGLRRTLNFFSKLLAA